MTKTKTKVLPVIARIQEAYRNRDGTYSKPHWDQIFSPKTHHNLIDQEEVELHLKNQDCWTQIYVNTEDDPRPVCRRFTDIEWDPKDCKHHCATVPVVEMTKREQVYLKLLDFVRSTQLNKIVHCSCGSKICKGICTFARMNKVLDDAGFPVVLNK